MSCPTPSDAWDRTPSAFNPEFTFFEWDPPAVVTLKSCKTNQLTWNLPLLIVTASSYSVQKYSSDWPVGRSIPGQTRK